MNTFIDNNIVIEHPTQEVIDWVLKNLSFDNPEYSKKKRMGFYVGKTPRKFNLYQQIGEDTIRIPFGTLRVLKPMLDKGEIIVSKKFSNHIVNYGKYIDLYDYQKDAVDSMKKSVYGILQAKAGCGKTQMGLALIQKFGKRALWITHTKDLLNQSKERAERYMDPKLMGTITEGKVNIGSGITFATVQTLASIDLTDYKYYWDVIIVDECHRVCASPSHLSMFQKCIDGLGARHKYGLSATVHRSDGLIQATFALLGGIVYQVPDDAVKDKVMQVKVIPVGTEFTINRNCLNPDGTIQYTKLITEISKNTTRNKQIVDLITNCKGSILVLSDRVSQLETLQNLLNPTMAKESVVITGATKKDLREGGIQDMREGKKRILFSTYALAKEGLDIPRLSVLIMATPVKDYAVVTQSIGRIARTFDGKRQPVCYDLVDRERFLVNKYRERLRTYRKIGVIIE